MKYVPSLCLLFRDTQNWDGLHLYPMAPFPVLDTGLGEAGGPRHWGPAWGGLAAEALGYCASLPYDFIKGLRRLGQPLVKHSCLYNELRWLGRVSLDEKAAQPMGTSP